MKTSQKGINLIKTSESLEVKAYVCPAGVLTIGYGTTKNVKTEMVITHDRAIELLQLDLYQFEKDIKNLVKSNINQNQFDALVSFIYNIGKGAFSKSTLLKKVNINPNDATIKYEFGRWNKAKGKVLKGLSIRREKESNLYFS